MHLAAGSTGNTILWKHNNQSSHKKLIQLTSFLNIWWRCHQSLPSKSLPVLDLCRKTCDHCPAVLSVSVEASQLWWLQFNHIAINEIKNNVTTQRQCGSAPSATAAHQSRCVTISRCTAANLWRQHELSVASTCFVCWFHQFFRRVYLKSANKYSGETCALAPIHASNWEPWASGLQDAPSLASLLHYSLEM